MKAEYVKYNAAWVRNEGIVRTLEPAYYGKVETTMSFLRSSMEVEPYDYQTTKLYLTDLKIYLDRFPYWEKARTKIQKLKHLSKE